MRAYENNDLPSFGPLTPTLAQVVYLLHVALINAVIGSQ